MKQLLLSEKWRPKNLGEVIILPRIRKIFETNRNQNFLLHGHFGTGKTTIARILIGKYKKNSPFLELNSSFYTSIDVLRNKIDEFCSKVYMGFDLEEEITKDDIKWVFLDEFERTSTQYQDALKAYIEEFSSKNVRFVLTTNHINKVSPGIRSRLIEINFDCETPEEQRYLKTEIYKRISTEICPKENFTIPKDDLVKIINKKFPDFRSIMIDVDNYKHTGSIVSQSNSINDKLKLDLFNTVINKSLSFDDTYHFLMNNFGQEMIEEMLKLLGTPLIKWALSERKINSEKLFTIASIVCEHIKLLETSADPIIVGISCIGKIRDCI